MIFTSEKSLVKDILSSDYICLNRKATISEVIDAMLINNLPEAFIVNEKDQLLGMITLSDIAKIKRTNASENELIESFMTRNVISVGKEYTVIDCKDLLRRHNIKRLPVMEKNKICGVIRYKEIEFYYYDDVEKAFASYDLLLNNMHDAVHVIDKNGKIILWNRAAEQLYGLKEESVMGKLLSEFLDETIYNKIFETQSTIENFYHSPKKGCHVVTNAHPILIGGELLGIISTDKDISEVEYLTKELDRVKHKLELMNQANEEDAFAEIRGQSHTLITAINIAKQVSKTQATIFITGESGTGKEVFARAIFNESYDTDQNNIFVPVNCSAIPSELFESEFFGYEPGAFTGASKKGKVGLFELANNGTIFLDEIGDLPLFMQAKLLRVLQENKLKRVGSNREILVKTRVISATNKDLLKMVEAGEFREDLYYRLNVIQIKLPPLRERPEDIKLLAMKFIKDLSWRNHKQVRYIADEVVETLQRYRWKGNIRELKNTIEYMVVMSKGDVITMDVVPGYIKEDSQKHAMSPIIEARIPVEPIRKEYEEMSEYEPKIETENSDAVSDLQETSEKQRIIDAIERAGGNRSKAAKLLGMPRSSFYYKIKKYDI
jgi:PAS domain S-box-containing protein